MSKPNPKFGADAVATVRHYLKDYDTSQMDPAKKWAIMGEQVQRFYEHHEEKIRLDKKNLTEAEWLKDIKNDPVNKNTDVDKEFGLARLWARQNSRVCTRAFLLRWLIKAAHDQPSLGTAGSGDAADRKSDRKSVYTEPQADWRRWIAQKYPRDDYPDRDPWEEMPWLEVSITIRQEIIRALP